eukprot:UN03114
MIMIARPRHRVNCRGITQRSRSLSPILRNKKTQTIVIDNKHNWHKHNKVLISFDLIQTINEDTKCYLNCMAQDTQIALCSFVAYNDLIHLSQTNKLWNDIIMLMDDGIVWRICFQVKWPLDEFTYSSSSESSSTESSQTYKRR